LTRAADSGAITRAHVITGGFGSGKTTAIRWLMANKPADELWPDLAGVREQQAFEEIAAAQYPAKRYLGSCRNGELPLAAAAAGINRPGRQGVAV
jgi:hypothetical protein